jgi:D-alanine-D-alanine ligase
MRKLRILVLMHEDAIPPDNYKELPAKEREALETEHDVLTSLRCLGHVAWPVGLYDDLHVLRRALLDHEPHLAFNILEEFHGLAQFDQNVVSYLELLKLPYTGCNPRGLTIARDKALTKKILTYHRVPVPRFQVFPMKRKAKRQSRLRFPLFVKSLFEEGSVGISQASVVHDDGQLAERVEFVHRKLETDAIVEEYIDGREIYVGVMGNDRLVALPIWEMRLENLPDGAPNIATGKVKWDTDYQKKVGLRLGEAKDLSPELTRHIVRHAKRIYRVLGLSGYARLDMRLRDDGKVFLIEANPNPQMAHSAEFAHSAQAAGIRFKDLLQKIIAYGLAYRPGRIPA